LPSVGLDHYRFNDQTDFDIDVAPGVVWEELNTFNDDCYDSKLKIEQNDEKRCFMISQEDEEDPSKNMQIKVKFFNVTGEEIDETAEDFRPKLRM